MHMCEGAALQKQASALQNKRSHVPSDEQHSQTIRLCFCNMVAFCLQPASWGWTQRHLYPHPLSSRCMYLVFLIGQSWLTELSWQSGRSVERSSVVAHQNSGTKEQQQLCTGSESTECAVCSWQEENNWSGLCCVDLWQAVEHLVQAVMFFFFPPPIRHWSVRAEINGSTRTCLESVYVAGKEHRKKGLCANKPAQTEGWGSARNISKCHQQATWCMF